MQSQPIRTLENSRGPPSRGCEQRFSFPSHPPLCTTIHPCVPKVRSLGARRCTSGYKCIRHTLSASRRHSRALVPGVSKQNDYETADPGTQSVSGELQADHEASHLRLAQPEAHLTGWFLSSQEPSVIFVKHCVVLRVRDLTFTSVVLYSQHIYSSRHEQVS